MRQEKDFSNEACAQGKQGNHWASLTTGLEKEQWSTVTHLDRNFQKLTYSYFAVCPSAERSL